jgi:hypothetical protein
MEHRWWNVHLRGELLGLVLGMTYKAAIARAVVRWKVVREDQPGLVAERVLSLSKFLRSFLRDHVLVRN